MPDLASLTTESNNPFTSRISSLSALEILTLINDQDALIASTIRSQLPAIAAAIDNIVPRLQNGGRVVYFGAGTSGRLGVLDASECLPTYNSEQFVGLMAGGDDALRKAKEGVEDSEDAGRDDLVAVKLDPEVDVAVGIASSGRTPYVIGGLRYARQLGCLTVGIVCTSPSEMGTSLLSNGTPIVTHSISAVVGPEVVTGSTRMKAGTATKLVLNMISTGCMIRLGKTYGNLMVDVRVSNLKLRARGHRLIRSVCEKPDLTDEYLDKLIASCDGSVKLAIVVTVTGWTVEKGRTELDMAKGKLEDVLASTIPTIIPDGNGSKLSAPLFLCIDGGGTSTRAIITTVDNEGRPYVLSRGAAGPSNVATIGIHSAVDSIRCAIGKAFCALDHMHSSTSRFSKAWIGCAGIDVIKRPSAAADFKRAVSGLLCIDAMHVRTTSDAALFSALVAPGIILIAGTGSIVMRFDASGAQIARAGGLGYIIGDEGSGYDIGRQAIRHAIATAGRLRDALLHHFKVNTSEELVNAVYAPTPDSSLMHKETPKNRVSGAAPVVFEVAFGQPSDTIALNILQGAATSLVRLLTQFSIRLLQQVLRA